MMGKESTENAEQELSTWLATYGMLTAERVLVHLKLPLDHQIIGRVMREPRSLYYQILRVPLKNVFNGIILEQVSDYRTYAQKLFIDYLISGTCTENEESPGASIRDDLETERLHLLEIGEQFEQLEFEQSKLIAKTQSLLIDYVRALGGDIPQQLTPDALAVVEQLIAPLLAAASEINQDARSCRTQFHALILHATEMIELLPDYKPNVTKQLENRQALYFDADLGDEDSRL